MRDPEPSHAAAVLDLESPAPVVTRLARALERRGHALAGAERQSPGDFATRVHVLGPGVAPGAVDRIDAQAASGDRLLALGWIGSHRDARAVELRRAWELEERCRSTRWPTLALRLGPLVGPESPLWRTLAGWTPRGRLARKLVHPVLEDDVVATLDRALRGIVPWSGWQEVGGPQALELGELARLARAARPAPGGAWEPEREALLEQRLIEPEVWARWSRVEPRSVTAWAA